MDRDKYIMIQISMIPQKFVEKYNLAEKSTQWIHICKGNKGNIQTPPTQDG